MRALGRLSSNVVLGRGRGFVAQSVLDRKLPNVFAPCKESGGMLAGVPIRFIRTRPYQPLCRQCEGKAAPLPACRQLKDLEKEDFQLKIQAKKLGLLACLVFGLCGMSWVMSPPDRSHN